MPLADPAGDFRPRPEEARLDRSVRQVEGLADLLVREPVEVAENEDLRQVFRYLGEDGEEDLRPLLAQRFGGRVVVGLQKRRHRVVGDEAERLLALTPAIAVDAEVS